MTFRRRCLLQILESVFPCYGVKTINFGINILLVYILSDIALCQLDAEVEFVDMQLNYTYVQGDLATLYCRVKHLGKRSVIWRRTSQPSPISVGTDIFAPDDRYHVQHLPYRGNWNLLIKNVNVRDSGVYECQISAKERAGSRRLVLLTVVDPPSTTTTATRKPEIQISDTTFVEIGSTIELTCNASSMDFPSDDIDWFRDGHPIKDNFKIQIFKHVSLVGKSIHSALTIKEATLLDAGTYVCQASDRQIISTRVHVLSARSQNSKRGTDNKGSSSREGYTLNIAYPMKHSCSNIVISLLFVVYILHRRT